MGKVRAPEEVAARKAKKETKKNLKQAARVAAAPISHTHVGKRIAKTKKRLRHDAAVEGSPRVPVLPFQANPDDHCETSPAAFRHVVPLLRLLATRLGKSAETLRIYDPYFCSGASRRHLAALGFPNVHNFCEDFYAIQKEGKVPEHDVVVTNPPYSEDPDGGPNHICKLFKFLSRDRKPFLLNMPEYVASARYYHKRFAQIGRARYPKRGAPPVLLCPAKRYHFWSPLGARPEHEIKPSMHAEPALGVRLSPFVALWYIDLMPLVERMELLELASQGQLEGIRRARATGCETMQEPSFNQLCGDRRELPEGRFAFRPVD